MIERIDRAIVVQHSTTFAPACRMVLVCVYLHDGSYTTAMLPVVGLRDQLTHRFHRRRRGPGVVRQRHCFPSVSDAKDAGFILDSYCGPEHVTHPLIIDEEFGVTAADGDWEVSNGLYRLVSCPWPPEDDARLLLPVVEELKALFEGPAL